MTVKELKEKYYNQKLIYELERDALNKLLREYCVGVPRIWVGLLNCLLRNGIYSIDQLKATKIEDIKPYNLLGKTRMPYLIKVKEFLDTLEDD